MATVKYDIPEGEWKRTKPDILVYHPKGWQHKDGENEHFQVLFAPSGDMLATWNQATFEGSGDHHVALARSKDEGRTWSEPVLIAQAPPDKPANMCSWGFLVVSASGRIYLFYNQHTGKVDFSPQFTGELHCKVSDDDGQTWSAAHALPMKRTKRDHPDPSFPANWIVWQTPFRGADGTWMAGFTRWTSQAAKPAVTANTMWNTDSRCELMRFDNLDDGPAPGNIHITWLPESDDAIGVPFPYHADTSCAQEPSIVVLPDRRLFMVMRTMTGHIWYTVSVDGGVSWRPTEILRYRDGDRGMQNPMTCSPIYALQDGRFILLYANNDGTANGGSDPGNDYLLHRRPYYIALGEFRPEAHQPIWFSQPKMVADTDGVPLGPWGLTEVCTYTSLTERNGRRILWYPDRKFFLLGKYITDEWISDMAVP